MALLDFLTPEERKGLLYGSLMAAGMGILMGRSPQESLLHAAISGTSAYSKGIDTILGIRKAELDEMAKREKIKAEQLAYEQALQKFPLEMERLQENIAQIKRAREFAEEEHPYKLYGYQLQQSLQEQQLEKLMQEMKEREEASQKLGQLLGWNEAAYAGETAYPPILPKDLHEVVKTMPAKQAWETLAQYEVKKAVRPEEEWVREVLPAPSGYTPTIVQREKHSGKTLTIEHSKLEKPEYQLALEQKEKELRLKEWDRRINDVFKRSIQSLKVTGNIPPELMAVDLSTPQGVAQYMSGLLSKGQLSPDEVRKFNNFRDKLEEIAVNGRELILAGKAREADKLLADFMKKNQSWKQEVSEKINKLSQGGNLIEQLKKSGNKVLYWQPENKKLIGQ